jgi:hypothetical protein
VTGAHAPDWRHTSGPYRVWQHEFEIGTNDKALANHLDVLWNACRVEEVLAPITYGFELRHGGSSLYRGVEQRVTDAAPSLALRDLIRMVNRDAIDASSDLVVLHASGAVRAGTGVLLPAAMEAGKSTLVAGLVRAGWRYLSDEAIGIDPETLELRAYPKPISIDPGSWPALRDLEPELPDSLSALNDIQWQIAPRPTPESTSAPVHAHVVVAPQFVEASATTVVRMSVAEAVMAMADSCFTLPTAPSRSLEILAEVARGCRGYRLTFGDLVEATTAIEQIAAG